MRYFMTRTVYIQRQAMVTCEVPQTKEDLLFIRCYRTSNLYDFIPYWARVPIKFARFTLFIRTSMYRQKWHVPYYRTQERN